RGSSVLRGESGRLEDTAIQFEHVREVLALTHRREELRDVDGVEAAAKQTVDHPQLSEVGVVVERRAPLPSRRAEQPALAVGADVAGAYSGDLGQLLKPVLGQRNTPRAPVGPSERNARDRMRTTVATGIMPSEYSSNYRIRPRSPIPAAAICGDSDELNRDRTRSCRFSQRTTGHPGTPVCPRSRPRCVTLWRLQRRNTATALRRSRDRPA